MQTVTAALRETARIWLRRLLTQGCRDPHSPLWGSFDRDWWHYRIRDFPSIILQQGGYAVYLASQWGENTEQREAMLRLAAAAARFWNSRAVRPRAFEEYYPWEQGYPPLAFSTLAVMKLVAAGVIEAKDVEAGAAVAARQLQSRFEPQAANQQIAGLAALAYCRKCFPSMVSVAAVGGLAERALELQTDEGWFEEYGGPDLGYLSVTIDCLWDLVDATGEERFMAPIETAVKCIRQFIDVVQRGSIGMHNSRNTDYLVPYGLVRLAIESSREEDARLVERLFGGAREPWHFLNAVDDRYVSHYIGQSLFRAVLLMEQVPNRWPVRTVEGAEEHLVERTTRSGHYLRRVRNGQRSLVTIRKGGIFSHYLGEQAVHDFGWVVETADRQYITHWWSTDWKYEWDDTRLVVEGALYEHREISNNPYKHMVLRVASLLLGARLIGVLKKRMIFTKKQSTIRYRRSIEWIGDEVHVVDTFSPVPDGAQYFPAPRSSKRHVASADSYHEEDFELQDGFVVSRQFHRTEKSMVIVTTYSKRQ
jgi:hypothetical protein